MNVELIQWRLQPGRGHQEKEAKARKIKICELLDQGFNQSQIARKFCLTKARIGQLVAEIERDGLREKYRTRIFPVKPRKQIDKNGFLQKVDRARMVLTQSFLSYAKEDFLAAGIHLLEAKDIIEKLQKRVKGL